MTRKDRFPSFSEPWPAGSMVTASGVHFNLLKLDPDNIKIDDIAHGLAHMCRWNGHGSSFFSVAQHCCLMFDNAPKDRRLAYLLHDAEEAYWGDIIKPIKDLIKSTNPDLVIHMIMLRNMIMVKYGAGAEDIELKQMDLYWQEWEYEHVVVDLYSYSWDPVRAKYEFLYRFNKHFEDCGLPKPL